MLQAAGTGNLRKLAAAGVGNLRKLAARHGHHPPLEQSATTSSLGLSERTSWPWGLYLPPLASPPLSSLLPPPPLDAAVADSPPPPQGSASRQNSRESTRARGKRIVEANWGRVEDAEICAEAAFVLASRKDKGGFWGSVGGSFFLFCFSLNKY
jgi:hypothetical protein